MQHLAPIMSWNSPNGDHCGPPIPAHRSGDIHSSSTSQPPRLTPSICSSIRDVTLLAVLPHLSIRLLLLLLAPEIVRLAQAAPLHGTAGVVLCQAAAAPEAVSGCRTVPASHCGSPCSNQNMGSTCVAPDLTAASLSDAVVAAPGVDDEAASARAAASAARAHMHTAAICFQRKAARIGRASDPMLSGLRPGWRGVPRARRCADPQSMDHEIVRCGHDVL